MRGLTQRDEEQLINHRGRRENKDRLYNFHTGLFFVSNYLDA